MPKPSTYLGKFSISTIWASKFLKIRISPIVILISFCLLCKFAALCHQYLMPGAKGRTIACNPFKSRSRLQQVSSSRLLTTLYGLGPQLREWVLRIIHLQIAFSPSQDVSWVATISSKAISKNNRSQRSPINWFNIKSFLKLTSLNT